MSLLHRVNLLWANVAQPHVMPGWLDIADDISGKVFVRWMANLPDNTSPINKVELQAGRLWTVTDNMTDAQILNTFLFAMLAFMEHEVREGYRYQGRHIYMPHH
jgi:hypothetical protein